MTWKLNKLIRLTLLSLCSLAFSLFLCSSSVFAVDMWSTGNWQDNCNQSWSWHEFSYVGRYDLPHDAVPYCSGGSGTLYGARVEQSGNFGDSSKKYNKLSISLTIYQNLNFMGNNSLRTDIPANGYLITTDDVMYKGSCSTNVYNQKTVWNCIVNAPDYKAFNWIGIDLGQLYGYSTIPIGFYGADVGMTGSLQYYSFSYNVESSSDPAVSGIQELVDQNNVIINQNVQMIELLDGNTEAINNQTEQLLGALTNQTSQEHSDYEAEKEEESERESEQSDSMDELSGVFSFTAFNPFSPILELFGSGDSCVDIPIIGSWLNLSDTEVCPFFPTNVRQILTPILGIFSMMLIFGFFVRWLGGNGGDNSLEVGDDNGYFRKG